MGSCATQTFSGITEGWFDCLTQKAADAGIVISGNEGQASRDGVTVRWKFTPSTGELELQCTGAPFFVGCGTVNAKIHDLVDGCQPAPPA
jgi:hypothetical protein